MGKEFYEVIIKDENGQILTQIKTDCVLASINDVSSDSTVRIIRTDCCPAVLAAGAATIDSIKKTLCQDYPFIESLDKAGVLEGAFKAAEAQKDETADNPLDALLKGLGL